MTKLEIEAVNAVLSTTNLSIGPQLEAFEAALASYVGLRHGIGLNSGTSGLHLTMIAAGVEDGDEVITPSFSFIASANAVLYERATPVFVDIDPQTGNIDPSRIEAAITDRTKAIMPVHAFGQPADMDPIIEIARKHQLIVIEDACEAIGAEYRGQRVGTIGDAAVFAFYPNKQMTTGEGGMIVTDRDDWAELFRSLRNQGRDVFDAWLNHTRLGYNYRLDEMSAALGLVQMRRLDSLLAKRAQVAQWYNERIDEIPGVEKPFIFDTTTRMSWFVYVVRCVDGVDRNKLMALLHAQGIPSRPYFTPIHLQPFYREKFGWVRGDLPHTEKAGDTFLALPFSGVMTETQVSYVCSNLSAALR
ncbi:MAG: DegT/DnrJ/EryC1/StrS family aminotransferase [Anaerolineae bacterium]|nr:DegT/DnrJ/EryC1/StrS family aminotransferase [Anaerolineae bacterium]